MSPALARYASIDRQEQRPTTGPNSVPSPPMMVMSTASPEAAKADVGERREAEDDRLR